MEDQGMAFDEADYVPAVISYYSDTDGNMLSLPFNSSTPVMWINVTLFEENDLEIPTTWDEVIEAARVLKEAGVPAPFGFGWQSWTMIENFAAWHDLPLATMENGFAGTETEFVFNSPEPWSPISTVSRTWSRKACSSTAAVAATRVRNSSTAKRRCGSTPRPISAGS
jgi:ABC-type glycerol-3-phosphate transport system substrate-binding protein